MSKKDFYRQIEIKNPCSQDWETMHGNDIVRFCDHCAKNVNNLSAMNEKEALRLVKKSKGRICVKYHQDPRTKAPLFSEQMTPITRRKPFMAAGVMSVSLSLSTLAFAQGGSPLVDPSLTVPSVNEQNSPNPADTERELEKSVEADVTGSVYGTVKDPNGAVIPNADVAVLDADGNQRLRTKTGDDGTYSVYIPADARSLTVNSPGFIANYQELSIRNGQAKMINITLNIGAIGGAIVIAREYQQPLAKAVEQNDVEAVRNLIAQGEDINGKEEDKITPLFIAVENGNLEIAEILIDFGANVNARNEEKETPLMKLNDNASKELVELLIHNGAKVNLTSMDGDTALILASENAKPEIVQALINAGAEINARNEDGQTALINAAYADDLEKVRMLLNSGAEVNAKNNDGETAYDETAVDEIEQLLISYGSVPKDKPQGGSDDSPPASWQ